MFTSGTSLPIASWELPRRLGEPSVLYVRWLRCTPGAFIAVDMWGTVHVWNLLVTDKAPIATQPVELPGDSYVVAASSSDSERRPRKASIAIASSVGSVAAFTVSPHVLVSPPYSEVKLREVLSRVLG